MLDSLEPWRVPSWFHLSTEQSGTPERGSGCGNHTHQYLPGLILSSPILNLFKMWAGKPDY